MVTGKLQARMTNIILPHNKVSYCIATDDGAYIIYNKGGIRETSSPLSATLFDNFEDVILAFRHASSIPNKNFGIISQTISYNIVADIPPSNKPVQVIENGVKNIKSAIYSETSVDANSFYIERKLYEGGRYIVLCFITFDRSLKADAAKFKKLVEEHFNEIAEYVLYTDDSDYRKSLYIFSTSMPKESFVIFRLLGENNLKLIIYDTEIEAFI